MIQVMAQKLFQDLNYGLWDLEMILSGGPLDSEYGNRQEMCDFVNLTLFRMSGQIGSR